MSGKINASLNEARSRQHIDPRSSTHRQDFRQARAKVSNARILRRERLAGSTNPKLQHASLDVGICLDADFRELSFDAHQALLARIHNESGFYLSARADRPGKRRRRRVSRGGLKTMAVTFRPDHAIALSSMEETHAGTIRAFMVELSKIAVEEFEAMTGLTVEVIEIHPEEGVLHLHITYRVVRDGQHLLANGERGWQGVHRLRQGVLGVLRQVGGNVRSASDAQWAYEELARVLNEVCGGDFPVNFEIARAVDAAFELLSLDPALRPIFAAAKEKWRQDVARTIEIEKAEDEKELVKRQKEKIATLEDHLDQERSRREELEQELADMKAERAKVTPRSLVQPTDHTPSSGSSPAPRSPPASSRDVAFPNL